MIRITIKSQVNIGDLLMYQKVSDSIDKFVSVVESNVNYPDGMSIAEMSVECLLDTYDYVYKIN